MKHFALLLACALTASSAFAQSASMQSPAYQDCTALASSNPSQALIKADSWLKIDTSLAAQHCRALALYGLGRFDESAGTLATLRDAIPPENITLRSYVTRQAARSYANANMADRAFAIIDAQISDISTVRGDNSNAAKLSANLLLDRARLNTTYGRLDEATKDLDHAVSLTPVDAEVLLERAAVFEKLGDTALARNDLNAVLTINSTNAQAKSALNRLSGKATDVGSISVPAAVVAPPASEQRASTSTPSAPNSLRTKLDSKTK